MADSLHDKENDGDTPTDLLDDYSWLCFLIIFELVVHYWLYNLWLILRVVISRCGHEIQLNLARGRKQERKITTSRRRDVSLSLPRGRNLLIIKFLREKKKRLYLPLRWIGWSASICYRGDRVYSRRCWFLLLCCKSRQTWMIEVGFRLVELGSKA